MSICPVVALVAACGLALAGPVMAQADSPPPAAPQLFGAVEHVANGSTVVRIYDSAGRERAAANFIPPGPADLQRPDPVVAAGQLWWVDAWGAVWSLAPDAQPVKVAGLPDVDTGTLVSLAVSPGGGEVAAALVTLPPAGAPPQYPARTEVVVLRNAAASTVRWNDDPDWYDHGILELAGFDVRGPVGVENANVLGGGDAHGQPVQLDLTGAPAAVIGSPSCRLDSLLPDGSTLCASPYGLAVTAQRRDGSVLLTAPILTDTALVDQVLSPDGRLVAQDTRVWDGTSATALPAGFRPQGWLDPRTVIGLGPDPGNPGMMVTALVHLERAGTLVTVGKVSGSYLGTLGADVIGTYVAPGHSAVAAPQPTAAPPRTPAERLHAWAQSSTGVSVIASVVLLLLLAYAHRRRIDTGLDGLLQRARALGPAARARASHLYHRYTDNPEVPDPVKQSLLRNGQANAMAAAITPPPRQPGIRLFAAALRSGAARAVSSNPASFDRFCIVWMASSQLGRGFVAVATHDLPQEVPWAKRLEIATMHLRDTPQFPDIAEELVGPWMNSEFRNHAEVGQFTSFRLEALFHAVVQQPLLQAG